MRALSQLTVGLTLTMALAAGGCATTQAPTVAVAPPRVAPPGPPPPSLEGAWNLALVRGAPQGVRLAATLKIQNDRAEGVSDCGAFTARAPNLGMDLQFNGLVTNEQTCNANVRALEKTFIDALSSTRTVQMREGYLVLMDERGREQLYFARGG